MGKGKQFWRINVLSWEANQFLTKMYVSTIPIKSCWKCSAHHFVVWTPVGTKVFLDERDDSYIELLPLFFLVFSWFGILNTSISGEMSQHLMSVLSKYVPQLKKDSGNVVLDRVFVDGDQLTEQSAHNENVLVMFNGFLGW